MKTNINLVKNNWRIYWKLTSVCVIPYLCSVTLGSNVFPLNVQENRGKGEPLALHNNWTFAPLFAAALLVNGVFIICGLTVWKYYFKKRYIFKTYLCKEAHTVCDEKNRFRGDVADSIVNFALIFSNIFLIRVLDVQIRSFVDERGGISAGEFRVWANFLPRDIFVSYGTTVHFAEQFRFDSRRIYYSRSWGAFNLRWIWKICDACEKIKNFHSVEIQLIEYLNFLFYIILKIENMKLVI